MKARILRDYLLDSVLKYREYIVRSLWRHKGVHINLMYTFNMKLDTKALSLSKRQREILVGTLLGDAHLETRTRGNTYRLKIEHSEKQKEYLFWLHKEFKGWTLQEPKRKVRADGRVSYEMVTISHSAFRFYAHQFYVDGKKVIPRMISKLLTPLGIALWYMDDGSLKSSRHKTHNIHTLGYSKSDIERVCNVLKDSFGIVATLHRQRNTTWRIYIKSESSEKFTSLVYETMKDIPSMLYKLKTQMPKK